MPPAISDEELSDAGDVAVSSPPAPSRRSKSKSVDYKQAKEEAEEDDVPEPVTGDIKDDEDEEDEDDEDEMEDDEYVVEKIMSHIVTPEGELKFEVKWEGYEKKSDRTWEDEDNLKENASVVLSQYLNSVGGREKAFEDTKAGLKTKKRGRPSASGTPVNGTKRSRKNDSHPRSATPPVSAKAFKPPAGSWEDEIESIDACEEESTGKLVVYLTWKNGQRTQHDTRTVYSRCPQKMLQYYERHVKIVRDER